jgi:peptidoglycan/LPS O-acetylase OafA/YrhL
MQRSFLPPLTGVRGLAALWVLFFHLDAFVPIGEVPVISPAYSPNQRSAVSL